MGQPAERGDRVGADLAQQRGEVVVEALARHQPVAECQDHHEGLHEGAAARRHTEERPDMLAVPGRFGNVEFVGGDIGPLAGAAADLDVEGVPPLPVMIGRTGVAAPALAGREVLERALGMERRQRAVEIVGILGLEVAADEACEVGIHGGWFRAMIEL